jgi:hypothetical protein
MLERVVQRKLTILVTLAIAVMGAGTANSVVVLDETWSEYGGSEAEPSSGFGAHIALAKKKDFAAGFGLWDGDAFAASGTWIGNDSSGSAYILTSAHNFEPGDDASVWTYVSSTNQEYGGSELWLHPNYDHTSDQSGDFDLAIVRLDGSLFDVGPQPLLYQGASELGGTIVIVGYGSRGLGSTGEQDEFYDEPVAAAAMNIVDDVNGECGNHCIMYDFDASHGSANGLDGSPEPINKFEGILGSGDSGGGTWLQVGGDWVLVGVNSWGDDSVYGSVSSATRISDHADWISSVFPEAAFTE